MKKAKKKKKSQVLLLNYYIAVLPLAPLTYTVSEHTGSVHILKNNAIDQSGRCETFLPAEI